MKLYGMVTTVLSSDNILSCANALLDFVQQVRKEEDPKTLVDYLYEALRVNLAFGPCGAFGNNMRYCVLDGVDAINAYLFSTMPRNTRSVASTLSAIEEYAHNLLSDFSAPVGPVIASDSVTSIVEYLNKEYDFCRKVFGDQTGRFIILNSTHKEMDASFAVQPNMRGQIPLFFLYAHREECKDLSPESVLFHELGHAIHLLLTGDFDVIPSQLICDLEALCFPGIASAPVSDQRELLAEVFSVGLMRGSPFQQFDGFDYMEEIVKDVFSRAVKVLLA